MGVMPPGRVLAFVAGPSILAGTVLIAFGSTDDWYFWFGVGCVPAVAILNLGVLLLERRRIPLSSTTHLAFWLSLAGVVIAILLRSERVTAALFGSAVVLRIAWHATFADRLTKEHPEAPQ
jgi:uncharacterized membrane protein SirB2